MSHVCLDRYVLQQSYCRDRGSRLLARPFRTAVDRGYKNRDRVVKSQLDGIHDTPDKDGVVCVSDECILAWYLTYLPRAAV